MANGWGTALAAAVNGWQQGTRIVEDAQERKDEKAWRDEQRAAARQGLQDERAARDALVAAGRPIALVEGAGGAVAPPTMDNRDVGLPENSALPNQGLMTGGFSVAGKSFQDRSAAEAEVTRQNSPAAVTQRTAMALRGLGHVDKAMAIERSGMQNQAAQLELDEATEKRMNAAFDRKLFSIQSPEQLAQTLSGSPIVGGAQLSVLKSSDGRAFQLSAVGPDGQGVPIGDVMPTDGKGMQAAMARFAQGMNTVQRLTFLQHDHEQERTQNSNARAYELSKAKADEAERHNRAMESGVSKPPAGYRSTPSGNLEPIPGGPADQKQEAARNADAQQLTGSISSMDRLAQAANAVLKHPGLQGITGMRGAIPNIPGSDAANAAALLDTLKSQVGFGVLQEMRNNSKTGGALGAVSDSENKMLQANLAALDKAQSMEQFQQSLKQIIDYTEGAKDRMRGAFDARYKGAAAPATPSRAPTSGATSALPKVSDQAGFNALPSGATFMAPDGSVRRKP